MLQSCVVHVTITSELIRHIRRSLGQEMANTLACSIVQSRLDYCNSLLYEASESNLDRSQCLQNKLARVIGLRDVNDMRCSLHWLPIRSRIQTAVATYKMSTYDVPLHLRDHLRCYDPSTLAIIRLSAPHCADMRWKHWPSSIPVRSTHYLELATGISKKYYDSRNISSKPEASLFQN